MRTVSQVLFLVDRIANNEIIIPVGLKQHIARGFLYRVLNRRLANLVRDPDSAQAVSIGHVCCRTVVMIRAPIDVGMNVGRKGHWFTS